MSGSDCEYQQVRAITRARAACNRFFDQAERHAIGGDKAMFDQKMMGEYQFALNALVEVGEQFTICFSTAFAEVEFRDPSLENQTRKRQARVGDILWNETLMREPFALGPAQPGEEANENPMREIRDDVKNAAGEHLTQIFHIAKNGGNLVMQDSQDQFEAGTLVLQKRKQGIPSCANQADKGEFRVLVRDARDGKGRAYKIPEKTFNAIRETEAELKRA